MLLLLLSAQIKNPNPEASFAFASLLPGVEPSLQAGGLALLRNRHDNMLASPPMLVVGEADEAKAKFWMELVDFEFRSKTLPKMEEDATRCFSAYVDGSETLQELKQTLSDLTGVPVEEQDIRLKGSSLKGDGRLSEFCISKVMRG